MSIMLGFSRQHHSLRYNGGKATSVHNTCFVKRALWKSKGWIRLVWRIWNLLRWSNTRSSLHFNKTVKLSKRLVTIWSEVSKCCSCEDACAHTLRIEWVTPTWLRPLFLNLSWRHANAHYNVSPRLHVFVFIRKHHLLRCIWKCIPKLIDLKKLRFL